MKFLFAFLLLLAAIPSNGTEIQLSGKASVSVITCAPWQGELYSAFGHSAIRVYDPVNNIDLAYNYGTFDFDQPNFYLNFTRGHLLYKLSVQPYPQFRAVYLYYNRWVHEQVLNLDSIERQQTFEYLQWNAKPQNQNYLYDYFYNNCATKIRDVFAEVLKDKIRFDGSYITTDYTIRELTDLYLRQQPWGDLGIDICLGLPMDKHATPYEYMFLPDYIESGFNHAFIKKEGIEEPVVLRTIVSNPSSTSTFKTFAHPWIVFGLFFLAIAGISYYDFKRKELTRWLDAILLATTGLIGLLLLVLWTATDHKAAVNNFNVLWAMPVNLIFAVLIFGNKNTILKRYFAGLTLLTVLLLVMWPFLPQQLNVFLVPVVAALGLRYFLNYWIRK